MPRRPRPTTIYREEVTDIERPLYNSTRQTFDAAQYEIWRRILRRESVEVRFYVGEIEWREAP